MGRGQALNAGIIWAVIVMLVAVSLGGLVFGRIQTQAGKITEGSGTHHSWENAVENAGTAYLYGVEYYDGLDSASVSCSYNFSGSVQLTITLNGSTVRDATLSGSGTLENDVAALVNEGTNTLTVSVDNTARIVALHTTLKVTTYSSSAEENIVGDVTRTGSDVFPLILLMVIVGVLGSIVAVLKVLL